MSIFKKKNSSVDILIPTYNQSGYLEQCITSALNQDYDNFKVKVVDDASNDCTNKVIKKFLSEPKFEYHKNDENIGRIKNYQKGLYEISDADYVLNLDGDDWLINNTYISKAVALLDENSDIACVTGNKINFIENENKFFFPTGYNGTLKSVMSGDEYLYEYINNKVSFCHLSTVYRRELAISNGFYTKDITFTDGESFFRLICGRKLAFIDEVAGVWRVHDTNETKEFDIKKMKFSDFFSLEKSVFCEYEKSYPSHNSVRSKEIYNKLRVKRLKPFLYIHFREMNVLNIVSISTRLMLYDPVLFILTYKNIIYSQLTKMINLSCYEKS